jgi:anti-anti-sigma factor
MIDNDEMTGLEITRDDTADGVVVRLSGELDLATVPLLEDAVAGATATPDVPVALDLSGVRLVDSTGLRALLTAARAHPGRVAVMSPSREVRRMLELTLLTATIPVVDEPGQLTRSA